MSRSDQAPLLGSLTLLMLLMTAQGLEWIASPQRASERAVARGAHPSDLESETLGVPPQDLVFVTEDVAEFDVPGCDTISVFDSSTGEIVFQGDGHMSPGRLAAGIGADGIFAASLTANGFAPSIQIVRRDTEGQWHHGLVEETSVATHGGIAINRAADRLIIAESQTSQDDGSVAALPNRAPFYLGMYALPMRLQRTTRLQQSLIRPRVSGLIVEILPHPDSKLAHIVTAGFDVRTVDLGSLEEVGPSIPFDAFDAQRNRYHGTPIDRMHADLSSDGRYVMVGLGFSGSVAIVDTVDQAASTVNLGGDAEYAGGIAINKGWVNVGLVAVHQLDSVGVYRFEPPDRLVRVAQIPVVPPIGGARNTPSLGFLGPKMAIAWSGSGDRIIAATNHLVHEEFVVLDLDSTDGLSVRSFVAACRFDTNEPNDIVTLNGLIPPPFTPTAVPSQTATPTLVPSPSSTHTATATSTPTDQPTPVLTQTGTEVPTPLPRALFLPLVLREFCQPGEHRADVLLVIDASTSMLDATGAGRTKLDAARDAARRVIAELDLVGGDQVGLIAFTQDVVLTTPLSSDAAAIERAIDNIKASPGTCIPCAMERARIELLGAAHKSENTPALVLLTDGQSNVRPIDEAIGEADAAKAEGAEIFAVGLGEDVEEQALRQMVSRPSFYYQTLDAEALSEIFAAIVTEIPCPANGFWGMR